MLKGLFKKELVLDIDDLTDFIHNRTGISKDVIEQVLDTETVYMIQNGFTK